MNENKEALIEKALSLFDNISPSLFDVIRKEMFEIETDTNSVHFYKKQIINRFKYKKHSFNFLIERGWSESEVYESFNKTYDLGASINQCLDKYKQLTSQRRQEAYDELIKTKNIIYTQKSIRSLVTKYLFGGIYSTSLLSKEYYMCLGVSEEEAKNIVSEIQTKNSNKLSAKRLINPEQYDSCNTNQIKYWLKLGYSEEESRQKVKERQTTFSLEKCITRYGKEKGLEVFNKRQETWQNSLVNKPNYAEICKSRGVTHEEFIQKYGLERAIQIKRAKVNTFSVTRASKESLSVFIPLYKWLRKNNIIDKKEIFLGINCSSEFYIRGKDYIYFFDLTVPKLNVIIEFNGIAFHPKTRDQVNFNPIFGAATKEEIFDTYEKKKEAVTSANFSLLVIWSDETVENNLSKCKDFILEKLNNENCEC